MARRQVRKLQVPNWTGFNKIREICDPRHSHLGHQSDRKSAPAGCTRHPKEGAMPNRNFWNTDVPRAEHDHRAHDTRLRLEHLKRLFMKRDAAGTGATHEKPKIEPDAE